MPMASLSVPKVVVPQLITDQVTAPETAPDSQLQAPLADELAPLPEIKVETHARPSGDLASLVAQFRSSDPGSR